MKEITFSRPADEMSCIVGNLFQTLQPPCFCRNRTDLVIMGITHSLRYGKLIIKNDHCIFYGEPADLDEVLNKACVERRCKNG